LTLCCSFRSHSVAPCFLALLIHPLLGFLLFALLPHILQSNLALAHPHLHATFLYTHRTIPLGISLHCFCYSCALNNRSVEFFPRHSLTSSHLHLLHHVRVSVVPFSCSTCRFILIFRFIYYLLSFTIIFVPPFISLRCNAPFLITDRYRIWADQIYALSMLYFASLLLPCRDQDFQTSKFRISTPLLFTI